MNYRHAFHAGNFADLGKHAVLTALMRVLIARAGPLTVIDTHAGAGLYDLEGDDAKRTGEAAIDVLTGATSAPPVFDDLKAAVRRANGKGALRYYPGSPLLIAGRLRARDTLLACELRPDDHNALKGVLPRDAGAEILLVDGWTVATQRAPAPPAQLLVFIDPPFERPDDHAQAVAVTAQVLRRNRGAVVVVWLPIKDLAGYDDFLTRFEDAVGNAPILAAETRLRPLNDPMKMNGCALMVVNAPRELEEPARAAVRWVASALGDAGAEGRVGWFGDRG